MPLLDRYDCFMMVHGNGPQVGQNLIRVEEAVTKVPPLPLDVCVAETQGSMGYILEKALSNELQRRGVERDLMSVLTQVEVDAEDPAFRNPTKPIGPFYTAYRAKHLMEVERWAMVEDSGRGYRKVVASPKPKRILSVGALRALYETGSIIISGGGGGIPVVRELDGTHRGVEAVIDKDRTSVLLAMHLDVDDMLIVTSVPASMLTSASPTSRPSPKWGWRRSWPTTRRASSHPGPWGPRSRRRPSSSPRRAAASSSPMRPTSPGGGRQGGHPNRPREDRQARENRAGGGEEIARGAGEG